MNKWASFVTKFNTLPDGKYFTRQELLALFPDFTEEQTDNYRLHVERAGFIRRNAKEENGYYKKVRPIPDSLGWRECIRQAYPNRVYYE